MISTRFKKGHVTITVGTRWKSLRFKYSLWKVHGFKIHNLLTVKGVRLGVLLKRRVSLYLLAFLAVRQREWKTFKSVPFLVDVYQYQPRIQLVFKRLSHLYFKAVKEQKKNKFFSY